ncbi:hypothetical protein MRB53_010003 [Persea americana]|uniref:Uncharacterized protein n=1 Tax=Persea americana TaxID=3435 RepID=A0ACC2LRS5_PERAE|nr:hypothetical protein MRB53_010003 [Persea americana]
MAETTDEKQYNPTVEDWNVVQGKKNSNRHTSHSKKPKQDLIVNEDTNRLHSLSNLEGDSNVSVDELFAVTALVVSSTDAGPIHTKSDDSSHIDIQEQEKMARFELDQLLRAEESMYKQRARDLAVNLGDSNTKYFYRLRRKRQTQAYISQIDDAEGNTYTNPSGKENLSHFSASFETCRSFLPLTSVEEKAWTTNAAVMAAAFLPAAEEAAGVSPPAVTSPVGSAAVEQRGVAPLLPATPAGGSPPTGAMGQAVLAAPTEAPTSTVPSVDVEQGAPHNRPWSCAPWAFLLVFLLLGIVYLLISHKFR